MTRAGAIVSMWLLLSGGIREAAVARPRAALAFLAFYLALAALTSLAVWLALDEGEAPRPTSPRRDDFFAEYE
jgi:hypothetical protein